MSTTDVDMEKFAEVMAKLEAGELRLPGPTLKEKAQAKAQTETEEQPEYEGPDPEGYDAQGRPRLDVGNWATAANVIRTVLGMGELAGIFRRSGELVHTPRIGEDGCVESNDERVDLGPAQVRPITTGQLAALVDVKFACGAWVPVKRGSKKKKKWQPRLVPQQAVTRAHDAGRLGESTPALRELRGVTHTPALRPDGSVIDQPGYDRSTGFLFLPDRDLDLIKVPDQPAAAEVAAARDLLLIMAAEFPFVTDDDRANFYGLAFTPLMRTMVPPPYRLGIFTAPNPGSGKGFLVRMIKDLHGGTMRGELPRDQEELRKTITATLVDTTAPVAVFDDLTGIIRSPILEALLTNPEHTDRLLGASRSVVVPNDRLWLATGNNAQIGGDLLRRVLFVEIDPGMPDPHTRTGFKIHPPTWVPATRGPLLAAMLTIVRGWVLADRPGLAEATDRSDDFMAWTSSMRAMLTWAGFPGSFGGSSQKVAIAADPDTDEWAAFLAAIYKRRKEHPFATKELVEDLDQGRVDPDALPGDLADKWSRVADTTSTYGGTSRNKSGFTKSLGRWMLNRAGRYAHGWKVAKIESTSAKHAHSWQVVRP